MQQSVLSEDLRCWTRHRREECDEERGRAARRREEGLDAAGEAPPAYVKEPERAHLEGGGEGVELRGLEGKPPDYEERRPSSR